MRCYTAPVEDVTWEPAGSSSCRNEDKNMKTFTREHCVLIFFQRYHWYLFKIALSFSGLFVSILAFRQKLNYSTWEGNGHTSLGHKLLLFAQNRLDPICTCLFMQHIYTLGLIYQMWAELNSAEILRKGICTNNVGFIKVFGCVFVGAEGTSLVISAVRTVHGNESTGFKIFYFDLEKQNYLNKPHRILSYYH